MHECKKTQTYPVKDIDRKPILSLYNICIVLGLILYIFSKIQFSKINFLVFVQLCLFILITRQIEIEIES